MSSLVTRIQYPEPYAVHDDASERLHKALEARSKRNARLLLKGGCENSRNYENDTPLHVAIRLDWLYACTLILKKNPDLLLENSDGQTPVELAADLDHQHLVVKLLRYTTTLDELIPQERHFRFLGALWYHANSEAIALAAKRYLPKAIYHGFVYDFSKKSLRACGLWIQNPKISAGLVKFAISSKKWELILYHFIGKKALLFVKDRQHLHHGSHAKPMHAIGLWTWRNFWQNHVALESTLFQAIDKAIGATIYSPPIASLTQKIQEGREPVIIPSGWIEHAVTVVFVGSLLFICNRGEKYAAQTHDLTVYRIANSAITVELVRKIISYRKSDYPIDEVGAFLYDTLPKALGGQVDSFCELLYTPACQPPILDKPICVAANLRLAIYAILLSQAVHENGRWNFSVPLGIYKDYTISTRYSVLHKYLSASHHTL